VCRRNIEVFERHNLAAIIINAAGCGSTLRNTAVCCRRSQWAERARQFSAK